MKKKICIKCNLNKELIDFPKRKDSKDGTKNECKSCYSKRSSIKAKNKKYINQKSYYWKKHYNLSIEDYNNLLIKQENRCLICGISFNNMKNRLIHIDHDHKTNKVRGILCNKCNCLLGCANDDILILLNSIKYLERN